jgi:hypothetical protein
MDMLKGLLSVAVTAVVLIGVPIGAHADVLLDPAVVHIGTGFGTACATGCGGDPNVISGDTFSVYLNPSGAPALSNPFIVIIGVPDYGSGTTAPTLGTVTFYDENSGSGTVITGSLIGTAQNGGDGELNNGDANAYEEAKYNTTTNNSNSWVNWSPLDPGVVEFDLYAFRLNQSIDGHDLIDVQLSSFTAGSFVIGYGCDGIAGDALNGACDGGSNNTYTTPFTEAGHLVPEPTTQVLLGFALLGLGTLARRRWRAE